MPFLKVWLRCLNTGPLLPPCQLTLNDTMNDTKKICFLSRPSTRNRKVRSLFQKDIVTYGTCHSLLEEICPQISAGKKFGPCLLDTWSQTNLEMSVSNFSIDAIQQNIICKKWKWNATIQTIQHSTKPKALKTLDVCKRFNCMNCWISLFDLFVCFCSLLFTPFPYFI